MKRKLFGISAVIAVAVGVLAIGASSATLPGSEFEIDDPGGAVGANLILDAGPGSIDWATVTQTRKADLPSGGTDDSYAGGVKEDTACPGVETGSIPPNKSDLEEFGGYFEAVAGEPGFLHVYWSRVQDPEGTTNMDFEFNRSTVDCPGDSKNVVRTVGDVLLQFDVDRGGAEANLSRRTWLGTAWSDPAVPLTDAEAIGSINQVTIAPANADGLGQLDPRTFGEASFDLSAVGGGDDCVTFGSAMLKSRSSDSFNSQLKDFIAPIGIGQNNCGAIKITKTRKHAATPNNDAHAGVTFTVNGETLTTNAQGVACIDGLALNEAYTVHENVPTGYSVDENDKVVTPDNAAGCADDPYTGETVSFHNTPLTNVTISAASQVSGGTMTSFDCDVDALDSALAENPSVTASNLAPQTITCEIVIDP